METSELVVNENELLVKASDYTLIELILSKTSYEFIKEDDCGRLYKTPNIFDALVVSRQLKFSKDKDKYDNLEYIYAGMDNTKVDLIEKSKVQYAS